MNGIAKDDAHQCSWVGRVPSDAVKSDEDDHADVLYPLVRRLLYLHLQHRSPSAEEGEKQERHAFKRLP